MTGSPVRTAILAAVALALVAGAALAGGTMKLVAAAAPIPKDTEPVELSGLVYQTRAWIGKVESIRLAEMPAPDAKKVIWIVRSTNTRASRMRIDVDLHLLDAAGDRLASGRKTVLLGASVRGAQDKIEIKIEPGVWERASEVRIEVRFMA